MQITLDDYKNFLDQLEDMNYEDVEKDIEGMKLNFDNYRNPFIEWKLSIPIFLKSFYRFVLYKKRIPTQEEFYKLYSEDNKDWYNKLRLSENSIRGLKSRVFRTHPSLVRDLHFSLFLKEKLKDCDVIYNINLDMKHGIDILLNNGVNLFGLNLFTKTKNSLKARKLKKNRHESIDNVNLIDIPIDLNNCKKCGDFFLYGESEYDTIIKELDKYNQTGGNYENS